MDIGEALRQADKAGELPIHRAAVLGNIEVQDFLQKFKNRILRFAITILATNTCMYLVFFVNFHSILTLYSLHGTV